jgi:hypothetical protein
VRGAGGGGGGGIRTTGGEGGLSQLFTYGSTEPHFF